MNTISSLGAEISKRLQSKPALAAGLICAYVATAALGLMLIKYQTGAPSDWMAGSFLICIALKLQGRLRGASFAFCTAATFAIALAAGMKWPPAALISLLTAGEALLATWLVQRISRTPRVGDLKQAFRLITFAILPAAIVSSLCAGALCQMLYGKGFFALTYEWFAGHGLGMVTTLPTLLLLSTPTRTRAPQKSWIEKGLLAAVIALFAFTPFSHMTTLVDITFLAIVPAATVFAFRLGMKPTVVVILALVNLSQIQGFIHPDPYTWGRKLELSTIVLIGQFYMLGVYFNALFTGLAIEYQNRMKRLMEHKTDVARRARARALSASRAKTDFLATMSHEIRTPLNGVLGFAQLLLKRDTLSPEDREQVELIGSSGYALLTVVNDILDFSKVEAGQVALNPRPTQLSTLAEEVVAIVRPEAVRKELHLVFSVEGPAEDFHMVDDHRVRQILINLLNNALKFTAHGGVALSMTIKDDGILFQIRDTGLGISPEGVSRLFRRFSQADSSITRTHGGTGLGLAICKGLVELMGGRIGVESCPGKGSTFWFEIAPPLACATNDDEDEVHEEDAITAHVLLVDDHPVNRQLGVAVLTMMGCGVDTAENGALALEAVQTTRYDLVLMDVHMPVMDGLEATRAIRALEGPVRHIPIVTMSADVLPEQVANSVAAGMNDQVSKPLNIQDLHACLQRWVGRTADGRVRAA